MDSNKEIWKKIMNWSPFIGRTADSYTQRSLEEEISEGKVHPEANALRYRDIEGLISIVFHSHSFSACDDYARVRREKFTYALMGRIRYLLDLRRKFCWMGTHEFGMDSNGHVHVVFSFDFLKDPSSIPDISNFAELGQEAVEWVCAKRNSEIRTNDVDFHWLRKWDQGADGSTKTPGEGLASYLCKKEPGHPEKHFFYDPDKLIHRLAQGDPP